MTNLKLIKISNEEYIFTEDSVIDIYSQDNKNYIRYNKDTLPINNKYNLPEMINNKSPISIKSKMNEKIEVSVHSETDYCVSFSDRSYCVHPGQTQSMFLSLGSTEYVSLYISRDKNSTDCFELVFTWFDEQKATNPEKETIRSRINDMYTSESDVKTFESNNTIEDDTNKKYYSDIEIISQAHKLDELETVGSGSFRDVYKIQDNSMINVNSPTKDCVIKIATTKGGITSNKREFQTWQTVKGTELEKYFCPVLNRGPEFKYIVMERRDNLVKELESMKRADLKKEIRDKLENFIPENEIEPPINHGFDLGYDNIVEHENIPVLIDYPYGANFEYL